MERRLSVAWLSHDEVSAFGLPLLLAEVRPIRSAQVSQQAGAVAELARRGAVDVVVIPVAQCAWFFSALRSERPAGVKVLVTLPNEHRSAIFLAAAQPVDGYLVEKDLTVEALTRIFDQLLKGEWVVPPEIVRELMTLNDPHGHAPRLPGRLTQREHEVLELLVCGNSNQQIATKLGISIHGAKRHMSNLLIKFNCGNRTEVALAAVTLGIVAES